MTAFEWMHCNTRHGDKVVALRQWQGRLICDIIDYIGTKPVSYQQYIFGSLEG